MNLPLAVPAALYDFFRAHPRIALAFSGGTDSAYLLYAATACGVDVHAYYVNAQFQPAFELEDARRLAKSLGAKMSILEKNILAVEAVQINPADRCYHCKNALFATLLETARNDGYTELMDGTNASDDAGDRPGMRALTEMQILSPLRLCGISKPQVRELSRQADLFTWNKPAYACLATRIPTGVPITTALLEKIERGENALFALGFKDFRVRTAGGQAKLQFPSEQLPLAFLRRREIMESLSSDFDEILLDLHPRNGG